MHACMLIYTHYLMGKAISDVDTLSCHNRAIGICHLLPGPMLVYNVA
jgi:hypothetical protein